MSCVAVRARDVFAILVGVSWKVWAWIVPFTGMQGMHLPNKWLQCKENS